MNTEKQPYKYIPSIGLRLAIDEMETAAQGLAVQTERFRRANDSLEMFLRGNPRYVPVRRDPLRR
jgi:hypothetical protein